jgi:hypothetical protein
VELSLHSLCIHPRGMILTCRTASLLSQAVIVLQFLSCVLLKKKMKMKHLGRCYYSSQWRSELSVFVIVLNLFIYVRNVLYSSEKQVTVI